MDYSQFGGKIATHPDGTRKVGAVPGEPVWDFGRKADAQAVAVVQGKLVAAGHPISLYDVAPQLRDVGVNKTTMLSHLVKQTLGGFFKSQYQPRGTCVSRGAKRVVDLCQALAVYFGSPLTFDYASHAYIYGTCREHGGDLSYEDGAVGAWAAWSVANDGNLRNADVSDDDNLDDLAVKWGAKGVPADVKAKGRLHAVKKVVPIKSYAEARDWIASGIGGVTVASNVGYEGSRDSNGVIRRHGSWSHQMCFTDQREDGTMKALLQNQSWGPDQPGGPLGSVEIPSYCWWTLQDDVEQQIAENDTFGFAWVDGWQAQDVTYRP